LDLATTRVSRPLKSRVESPRDLAVGRSEDELFEAAHEVGREWFRLAQGASDLSVFPGARSREDQATLEAFLVRNRALIHFVCGGRTGKRNPRDIQPRDFLDRDWWPDDEEIDRRLRGRLKAIDLSLAHIGWARVTDDTTVLWPCRFLAWETSWALTQFVQVLVAERRSVAPAFAEAQRQAYAALPAYEAPPMTDHTYAPRRR
jgi:hypothetical protein